MTSRRSALVTGGSRGIGAEVAKVLAGLGFEVWVGGRDEGRVAETAEACGGVALPFDLTDAGGVERACSSFRDTVGGPPDVLVNAAGVFGLAPLQKTSIDVFDQNVVVNLRGTFLVVRAFLQEMLDAGSGLIVNISSVAGRKAFPGNGAYTASKFGLRGLHEVLLEEVRGTGVRASLVEPGPVDTPLWDALNPDADPNFPDRARMLSPRDVAEAVGRLAELPAHVAIPLLQIERGD